MREMMQKLNVVKYATSEAEKNDLLKKGFAAPASGAPDLTGQHKPDAAEPGKEDKKNSRQNRNAEKLPDAGQKAPADTDGKGGGGDA